MEDIDYSKFVYRRQFTVSSFIWALWLRMPLALRTSVYRLMIRVGDETGSPRVSRLPFRLYAKFGDIGEALATQYVSTHTTIPVPTILDVVPDRRRGALFLMTRVPGRPLPDMQGNLNTLPAQQLSVFADTMRDWLTQLRSLTPPADDGSICGFLGGSLDSYRISFNGRAGPFESQEVFHAQPFCTLPPSSDPAIRALASSIRQKHYRICLTHGDLSPNNILVNEHFKPTGLVDWQCAAWMPEYWELTTALWRRQRYGGWVDAFTRALPQYTEELEVEMELWKTICPF